MTSTKSAAAPRLMMMGLALIALTLAACGGKSGGAAEGDMALGAPEGAKVTVVEYASPACIHCSNWQIENWAAFKSKYVDNNKVRYVFRELVTGPPEIATAGFLIARCAGPDRYFDVMHELLASQHEWMSGAVQPRAYLLKTAGAFGIDEQKFQQCTTDAKAIEALAKRNDVGAKSGITGTPTFVVNGKSVITPGGEGPSMADLSKAIDAELAK